MLTVPAAFTEQTGTAHWHALLRARAIENGAFVFAPAQCGKHTNGRRTYGHSLIVDPWGKIISDGGNEIGVTVTEVNMEQVVRARNSIGSLTHDKNIVIQTVS
jgi:predicted amidohydrolase